MAFNLMTALGSIAPTIATMLAGPLAGTAVTALESALGLTPGAGADAVTAAVAQGMTPEQISAVRSADQHHLEVMGEQGLDVDKLNADFQTAMVSAEVDDRKDARLRNSGRDAAWWIATAILTTFAAIMTMVLYGCWSLLTGGITIKDVSVVAAVSGLVGSVVGYVAANAQTVVNFIFGGSLGSQKKSDDMASAVKQALTAATK